MRLLTLTVRNYRLHRELSVTLHPALTVIGGPNETGKSTLVEAAHRAFFLRAKTTSEPQKAMISKHHEGHPEVEIEFEVAGTRHKLFKKFSGANGTVRFTEAAGATLSGEEAEEKLAALLGTDSRVAGNKLAQQWAHLWVWQGSASEDPTGHANAHKDSILAQLREQGGAVVVRSERDAAVAGEIAGRFEEWFNKNGTPKKGSPLGLAAAETEQAEAALLSARAECERLDQAVKDFQQAEHSIRESEVAIQKLQPELEKVQGLLARVASLLGEEQAHKLEAEHAAAHHEKAVQAEQHILSLQKQAAKVQTALAPRETTMRQLVDREVAASQRVAVVETARQDAAKAAAHARQRNELCGLHLRLLEKQREHALLEQKLNLVKQHQGEEEKLRLQLAQCPAITAAGLKKLQKAQTQFQQAATELKAMAATIHVVAVPGAAVVGGKALAPGEAQIITEKTEIRIGDDVRLTIEPGGGSTLAEVRKACESERAAFQTALSALGFSEVNEATGALARRSQIEVEIGRVETVLKTLEAATTQQHHGESTAALAALQDEVTRRTALAGDFPMAGDLAATQLMQARMQKASQEQEAQVAQAEADLAAGSSALKKVRDEITSLQQTLQKERDAALTLQTQIKMLVDTHGDETVRAKIEADALTARQNAEQRFAITRAALEKLQPDLLKTDLARFQRSLEITTKTRNDASTHRAVAANVLQRDGSVDPEAVAAAAEASAVSTKEHHASVRRQAEAIRLLNDLFIAEQRAAAEQFTNPLAEKINDYLHCIYGSDARAVVRWDEDQFAGIDIVRGDQAAGAFSFDALSGGTREQVAAATRLAMAEILAAGQGGCLPVFFDDAFTNSDPVRTEAIQRMLDLAARRGLQIIVLTCNPADYAALGAELVML